MGRLLDALAGDPEIGSLLSDEAQLSAILEFEAALARAEAACGLISPASAQAIVAGIGRYRPDWDDLVAGMARDGVVVPALLRQVRAVVGEAHAADLHKGATSQDAVDTALVLQLAKILPLLLAGAEQLCHVLLHLEHRQGSQPLMAHTRMQAALPFTVGDKLRSWRNSLDRQRIELDALLPGLLVVQLGGPIGDRSSFDGHGDAVAERLADLLGIRAAPAWHSDRDRIVTLGSRLASLCGVLGKLGADVSLLTQSERRAAIIHGAGSSSAMPHKTNPVSAEVLVAIARKTAGLSGILQGAMIHENERSGASWTTEWLILPELLVLAGSALRTATSLVRRLSFDTSSA